MKNTIKKEIEKSAKESGVSVIEMISTMQGLLAQKGDENGITELHKLKMTYIKKMGVI